MKTSMSFVFVMFLALSVFAADVNKDRKTITEKATVEVVAEVKEEKADTETAAKPEGIRCSAKNIKTGVKVTCWFCNCADLAESVK